MPEDRTPLTRGEQLRVLFAEIRQIVDFAKLRGRLTLGDLVSPSQALRTAEKLGVDREHLRKVFALLTKLQRDPRLDEAREELVEALTTCGYYIEGEEVPKGPYPLWMYMAAPDDVTFLLCWTHETAYRVLDEYLATRSDWKQRLSFTEKHGESTSELFRRFSALRYCVSKRQRDTCYEGRDIAQALAVRLLPFLHRIRDAYGLTPAWGGAWDERYLGSGVVGQLEYIGQRLVYGRQFGFVSEETPKVFLASFSDEEQPDIAHWEFALPEPVRSHPLFLGIHEVGQHHHIAQLYNGWASRNTSHGWGAVVLPTPQSVDDYAAYVQGKRRTEKGRRFILVTSPKVG